MVLLLIVFAITSFAMGFANESRGRIFTESAKQKIVVVDAIVGGLAIIYSILSKWYWGIALVVLIYFLVTGLGWAFFHWIKERYK